MRMRRAGPHQSRRWRLEMRLAGFGGWWFIAGAMAACNVPEEDPVETVKQAQSFGCDDDSDHRHGDKCDPGFAHCPGASDDRCDKLLKPVEEFVEHYCAAANTPAKRA